MVLLSRRQEGVTFMVVLSGSYASQCLFDRSVSTVLFAAYGLRLFGRTFTFVIHALLLAGIHGTVWCYQLLSPLQPLRTSRQLRDTLSLSRLEGRTFLSNLEHL